MALESRIHNVESGGDRFARNPRSTAYGPGQFIESTWMALVNRYRPDLAQGRSRAELLALRSDPELSSEMTGHYADENRAYLTQRGLDPTDNNLYLAHFAGPAGAAKLLANPNASAYESLGANAIAANPFLKDWSGQQVIDWAGKKMSGAAPSTKTATPTSAMAAPLQETDAVLPFLASMFGGPASAAGAAGVGAAMPAMAGGAGLGDALAGLFKGGDLAGLFGEASGKSSGLLSPLFGGNMGDASGAPGSVPGAPGAQQPAPMSALPRMPVDMTGLRNLMAARPQLGTRGVLRA